jgi:hypothetical protein
MIKKFVIGTAPLLACGITIAVASPTNSEISFPKHFPDANLQLAADTSEETGDPTLADPLENKGKSPSAKEIEYPDEPDTGDTDAAEREPYTSQDHVGLTDEPRREEIGEEGMTTETGAMEDESVDIEREPFTSKETTGIDPTPRVDD